MPKAPVKTVQELVAYAKANPDKANAAASGPIFQVVQKMFEQRTGTNFEYIAFRANSEAMIALMRGDALMSLSDIGPATGPLQDGRVRALAVTSPQRLALVSRRADHGGSRLQGHGGRVLDRPAGARQDAAAIIKRLQDEIIAIVKMPDVIEKLAAHQTYPAGNTSEEFAKIIARELVQWSRGGEEGEYQDRVAVQLVKLLEACIH